MSKTVLIVAYFSPLCETAGAARVRRFAKYLPQFGWRPVILTTRKRYRQYHTPVALGLQATDISLAPSFEVGDLGFLKPLLHRAKPKVGSAADCDNARASMLHPRSTREGIASRLEKYLVPDPMVSWFLPALLKGGQLFRRHRYDLIVASSPTPTALLVSVALKRLLNVPVILDFRDPWFGNACTVFPTRVHAWANRLLEGKTVEAADMVVCVTESMTKELSSRWNTCGRAVTIPNGYDPDEAGQTMVESAPDEYKKWRLLYAGSFSRQRTPAHFLQGLQLFLNANEKARGEVEVRFVGAIPDEMRGLCGVFGVSDVVTILPWQGRPEVLKEISAADVLIHVQNGEGMRHAVGSKLYEYLHHNRAAPVLAAVPRDGEAAALIRRTHSGVVADWHDPRDIADKIAILYRCRDRVWLRAGTDTFDGASLTGQLASLMDGVVRDFGNMVA